MTETRFELLQKMPIFGGIGDEALGFLLGMATEIKVARGSYFFREGEDADSMFVLEKGQLAILKKWHEQEYVLARLEPGACFGEMELIDLFPRAASAYASTNCTAIEIPGCCLTALYKKHPKQFTMIQMNMAREVSRRLRATDDQIFRIRAQEKRLKHKGELVD